MKHKKLVLSAFFITLGLLLPFVGGQIPEINSIFLPMHLPILICGFICGWKYGGFVGFITPLIRTTLFGFPLFPVALSMAFELCTYGIICGLLYDKFKKCKINTYLTLSIALIIGRIVRTCATAIIFGLTGSNFTFSIFLSALFVEAIPGIILQLVLVPTIINIYEKKGLFL